MVIYSDFTNIFLKKLATKLPRYLSINEYIINLEIDKKLLYRSINSLKLIVLKFFKTYIKIFLANNFIQSSKSLLKAPILL